MFYDSESRWSLRESHIVTMPQSLTAEAAKLMPAMEIPTNFSLENSITKIGGEDKKMFLDFVSRMLKWRPRDRSTAKDLLNDPWLRADFS